MHVGLFADAVAIPGKIQLRYLRHGRTYFRDRDERIPIHWMILGKTIGSRCKDQNCA